VKDSVESIAGPSSKGSSRSIRKKAGEGAAAAEQWLYSYGLVSPMQEEVAEVKLKIHNEIHAACVCMYVCMYVYSVRLFTYAYCTYVCMYACMNVNILIFELANKSVYVFK